MLLVRSALLLAAASGAATLPAPAMAGTVVDIAAGGHHTCALMATGNVKCWGYNLYGQLGLDDNLSRGRARGQMGSALPEAKFVGHGPVIQMALGLYHTCVLTRDGSVGCWGYNAHGELGLGHTNNIGDQPNEMLPMSLNIPWGGHNTNIVKIAAGWYHTCSINLFGDVRCWGWNNHGQLGTEDLVNRGDTTFDGNTPTYSAPRLGSGRRAIDIVASIYSTCVLLDNQQVKCWGYNEQGQLGLGLGSADRGGRPGDMGDALPALNLLGTPATMNPVRLVGGRLHHCAVFDDQLRVKCWGYNGTGQLGIGTTQIHGRNPNEMGTGLPFITTHPVRNFDLKARGDHSCVLGRHHDPAFPNVNSIQCWGDNAFGQLGTGDLNRRGDAPGHDPVDVPFAGAQASGAPHSVVRIAAGAYHTCALLENAVVNCWGYNGNGELGLGDARNRGGVRTDLGDGMQPVDL
jgi:alpha-tubulin suppressor-like RCC1 family protein